MTDFDTLVADLEAAPGGSRELDQRIWNVTRPSVKSFAPHYTTSLDAALTLVPEGMIYKISKGAGNHVIIGRSSPSGNFHNAGGKYISYNSATRVLAVCIAALKARAHK